MQEPPRKAVEVIINGHGGHKMSTSGRRLRPLLVDEALQFSPLTTSVSPGHNRIPLPGIGHSHYASSLISPAERASVQKSFNHAIERSQNQQGHYGQPRPFKLQLDGLIDGEELTEIKFKEPLLPIRRIARQSSNATASTFSLKISPIARMVLAETDVAYRYPTPSTPSPKISKCKSLPAPALSTPPTPGIHRQNQTAFRKNSLPSSMQVTASTPPRKTPLVIIPALPASSHRKDYVTIPDSPKRQKVEIDAENDKIALQLRAQQDEANIELAKFQDLLFEMFEAQDQLETDTSHASAPQDNAFFDPFDELEETIPRISTKIHSKLQSSIKRLVDFKRFHDLPLEYVKRLQKLCEHSVLATQSTNLRVGQISSDDESDQWRARLTKAENGTTSACTIIWTILGSLENKELCPEDVVQCLPNVLTNIFDNCLIPTVEARPNARSAELFQLATQSKDILTRLLHQGKKLLDLTTTLCVRMKGAESAINTTEFLATKLIFVENAHNEKESVLGFQVYEGIRRTAMEALAKIFSKFTDQRSFILDEILVSLEKLPLSSRSARQFKLVDGQNIQLLSALVMQLVQTTSLELPEDTRSKKRRKRTSKLPEGNSTEDEEEQNSEDDDLPPRLVQQRSPLRLLYQKTEVLHGNSTKCAQYIINFFVQRAMTSTKTGDQPYRNLLDLFVEDLISVLGSTDWPASELLLRIIAFHMIGITKDEKAAAIAKNMALELLGWMGSAISTLRASIKGLRAMSHDGDSDIPLTLSQLADDLLRGGLRLEDIITQNGPFRITLEYLQDRNNNNWQLKSARGFYLMQWAKMVCSCLKLDEGEFEMDPEIHQLIQLLLKLISDSSWLRNESDFKSITPGEGRLAYSITVLQTDFCKLFEVIVKVLLASFTSDQAKIRSRSLKSVIAMLETDPSLLDRDPTIIRVIFRCASDQSPMVRDSALSLIAKCMSLKPALEEEACKVILGCAGDTTVGVRKRSIGLMKEIYLRDSRKELKAVIAKAFLEKTSDPEESVAGLARQILTDTWVTPLLAPATATDSAKAHVALSEQASMIVKTVSQGADHLLRPLEAFLRKALTQDTAASGVTFTLFSGIVASLFEGIVNGPENMSKADREALLLTLTAFASANSKLIIPGQLKALQPYIGNLVTADDLFFFKSVVMIYRCVLPHLSGTQQPLLVEIQNDLLKIVSKLPRMELNEVMACLWTINGVLKNTERLVRLTISVLKGINQARPLSSNNSLNTSSPEYLGALGRLCGYVRIAGSVGKYCDLEKSRPSFREVFPKWKGESVAGLMADLIYPLTDANQPLSLRIVALESLGCVCQSWPGQFNKDQIRQAFSNALTSDSQDLQNIVLKTFAEFFGVREGKDETFADTEKSDKEKDLDRLGGSLQASDHDGAAALIAQHFLRPMLRISMAQQDLNALTSIRVIASINRQGLVHPKECAGALVALETSTDPSIAKTAFESHQQLHSQHETMFEREYMRAVQEAFNYQKDVVKDAAGATTRPFRSKLAQLFEIVKSSNAKYVRKFLSSLISLANCDLAKIETAEDLLDAMLLARFVVQNLGFLEFSKMDELLHTISQIENTVGKGGADVAQAIEMQVIGSLRTDPATPQIVAADYTPSNGCEIKKLRIDSVALKRLVMGAMILTMLWEVRTHLKRQYGVSGDIHHHLAKNKDIKNKDNKELAKAPSKMHGVSGDKFWDNVSTIMSSLDSQEAMMTRCREFTTLMSIDDEVKVAAEEEVARELFSASVDPEDATPGPSVASKPLRDGKRKSSLSLGGTPKKKRGRPNLKGRRSSNMKIDEDSDWD